jgi:hypothetical protein
MIPANAMAETVAKLQQDNESMSAQIQKNNEVIEQLSPLAEWTEEEGFDTSIPPTE